MVSEVIQCLKMEAARRIGESKREIMKVMLIIAMLAFAGDYTGDCFVDYRDLAIVCKQGNLKDYAEFANHWLVRYDDCAWMKRQQKIHQDLKKVKGKWGF